MPFRIRDSTSSPLSRSGLFAALYITDRIFFGAHTGYVTRVSSYETNVIFFTGGRFHWFKGSAAIESDDMKLISAEIEKSINFGTKASIIVDSVKNRPRKPGKTSVAQKKDDSPKRGFKVR